MIFKKALLLSALLLGLNASYANPLFKVEGSKQAKILINSPKTIEANGALSGTASSLTATDVTTKTVTIMKLKLSDAAKKQLREKAEYQYKQLQLKTQNALKPKSEDISSIEETDRPALVNLGMGKVPVLDQGDHGSCVTFATTAAIDAAYYNGDYASQLCSLSLGKHLSEQNGNFLNSWTDLLRSDLLEALREAINLNIMSYPSGWDGSAEELVLAQIKRYGIVSKIFESKSGCGGLSEYPTNDEENTGGPMSEQEYQKISERVLDNMHVNEFLQMELPNDAIGDSEKALQNLKDALSKGQHVVFATMVDTYRGGVGATAHHRVLNDTWVVTKEIIEDAVKGRIDGGHAMVIYGYNDNITITDAQGNKHQGLLFLRNSWGDDAGDRGDYYMTYDYFKLFADEATGLSRKY